MGFLIMLFIVCVGGGWLLGKGIGNLLFPGRNDAHRYMDKSVHYHHHYYDNRSVHVNGEEFKNLKK